MLWELVLGLYGSRRAGLLLVPAAEGKKMREKKNQGEGAGCAVEGAEKKIPGGDVRGRREACGWFVGRSCGGLLCGWRGRGGRLKWQGKWRWGGCVQRRKKISRGRRRLGVKEIGLGFLFPFFVCQNCPPSFCLSIGPVFIGKMLLGSQNWSLNFLSFFCKFDFS